MSVFTEIHQSLEYEGEEHSFNDFDSIQKKMDSSLTSLVDFSLDKYSKKGIPFYMVKLADIFPPDIPETEKPNQHHYKLRPEYFMNLKKPLNPDVFLLGDEMTPK